LQRPHTGCCLSHLRFPTRHILQALGGRWSRERKKEAEMRSWMGDAVGVATGGAKASDSDPDMWLRRKEKGLFWVNACPQMRTPCAFIEGAGAGAEGVNNVGLMLISAAEGARSWPSGPRRVPLATRLA
jgi:hypothetical protein